MLKHFLINGTKLKPKAECFSNQYFESIAVADIVTNSKIAQLAKTFFLTTKQSIASRILGSDVKRGEADQIADELLKPLEVIKVRCVVFSSSASADEDQSEVIDY